ncbi:MAG: RluA family pseudouridine synthase [Candidatus Pacebacteria bacterium]|nr:RluA family pseudouridine synthase [Candidatus Paceibacterota bacterium]
MSNKSSKKTQQSAPRKAMKIPKITILYEDVDIVAIDKPAGLMVHPDGRAPGPFITDWVVKEFPRTKNVGEPSRTPDGTEIIRPGIVHRLDRETSGVLLIAKTAKGHAHLKQQFQDRTMKKKYVAFVWGDLKEEFGTITRPIGRSGSDFRRYSASRGSRGVEREAETYWTKLATVVVPMKLTASSGRNMDATESKQRFTLMEAEPRTGRTHQIRVHFSAIQHPVVGDTLYAPNRPMMLGFERTALHARSIEFTTVKGEKMKVEAPLPKDFKNACKELGIADQF